MSQPKDLIVLSCSNSFGTTRDNVTISPIDSGGVDMTVGAVTPHTVWSREQAIALRDGLIGLLRK